MAEISYCGQVCAECPVFQASRENNQAQSLWLALEYSSGDHLYQAEEMRCNGCHSHTAVLAPMCNSCEIRTCAYGRVFISCAECNHYPCATIERLVPVDTDNRAELEFRHEHILSQRIRAAEILLS